MTVETRARGSELRAADIQAQFDLSDLAVELVDRGVDHADAVVRVGQLLRDGDDLEARAVQLDPLCVQLRLRRMDRGLVLLDLLGDGHRRRCGGHHGYCQHRDCCNVPKRPDFFEGADFLEGADFFEGADASRPTSRIVGPTHVGPFRSDSSPAHQLARRYRLTESMLASIPTTAPVASSSIAIMPTGTTVKLNGKNGRSIAIFGAKARNAASRSPIPMSAPVSPVKMPSKTNGQRTVHRVAPTSCMMRISRLRANTVKRIVL